jgi:hypothetical protein
MLTLIKPNVRKAILAAQGGLTAADTAATLLGIRRAELVDYLAQRPCLHEFVQNVREELADDSQAALGAALDSSAPWAVKYTLKTIGAHRGYVEGAPQSQVASGPAAPANPEQS